MLERAARRSWRPTRGVTRSPRRVRRVAADRSAPSAPRIGIVATGRFRTPAGGLVSEAPPFVARPGRSRLGGGARAPSLACSTSHVGTSPTAYGAIVGDASRLAWFECRIEPVEGCRVASVDAGMLAFMPEPMSRRGTSPCPRHRGPGHGRGAGLWRRSGGESLATEPRAPGTCRSGRARSTIWP